MTFSRLVKDRDLMASFGRKSAWRVLGLASSPLLICLVLIGPIAGLILYSQTWAWYGNEGFHLLASQLINSGKIPYLDFLYPQTPLYAYLNAGWMRIFGETWRSSHFLSALLTGASVILTADFLLKRVPEANWKLSAAFASGILMALNSTVIGFGTIGQAYGICLFLIVAAFRLATKATAESRAALALWSGLCAGAAAGSSLLSAPVLPILLAWITWHSASDKRARTCILFSLGAGISMVPLLWLYILGPRQTLFNTFEYHFFHRSPGNRAALRINLETLTELFNSGQFMLLVLFAAIGLLFVRGRSQWEAERKAEFSLCGWLTIGLGIFLATPRMTFPQYFILLLPFLSILASVGILAAGDWLRPTGGSGWLLAGVLVLFVAGLPWWFLEHRWLVQKHEFKDWRELESVARTVNDVTPQDGLIWADEALYFASHRTPPSGLEHSDSHKLRLSPSESAMLHVVSRADVYGWLAAGRFATVATCWATEDWMREAGKIYTQHAKVNGCDIFWSKASH